jgi:zinc/manganese transport system substrate-binding protein
LPHPRDHYRRRAAFKPGASGGPHPCRRTFSVIGDMLANVGGDHLDIKTIVGPAAIASYISRPQPTSRPWQPRALSSSTISTRSSSPGSSPAQTGSLHRAKVVVSRGVRTLTSEEEHPVSGRQLPAAIDQHAWLDPGNGVVYVRNIAEALSPLAW